MSSENKEPIPVPPPAPAPTTDEPATQPVPAEPTAAPPAPAPTEPATVAATTEASAPQPEMTPVAPAPTPTVTSAPVEAAPAPEQDVAPAPSSPAAAPASETEDAKVTDPVEKEKAETTEHEEPQNALTRKFSDADWKAVKELRSQLPELFKKAYPDANPAPESITLWGVALSTVPNAKASVILAKFARARELNVPAAAEMLVATLQWRDSMKIEEIMREEFDSEVFGKLGRVYGADKDGHPVAYNLYGAVKDMKAVFGDLQKFIRWRVQFMEQSIEALDFENVDQMVQIHDYEGVSLTQRDASQKAAAKEATAIFQNHYPEFLSRKFFINVPTLLTWIFWLFKPLISAATLAKMSVVGTGAKTIGAELSQVIDVKELPERYGGEADGF